MELTAEQSVYIKKIEADMLKAFVAICEENQLQYYLVGGTLLGAVRHQGFIPWDDDIDVGMPRADYDKFLQIAPKFLPSYYFLQTFESDPGYPLAFAKLRDSRTTFIETSMKDLRINHGVFLDVFPLDYYPEKKMQEKKFKLIHKLCSQRIWASFDKGSQKTILQKIIRVISFCLYPTSSAALKRRERLFCEVKKSAFLKNHSGAWGQREIMPIKWFGAGEPVVFEGLTVNAPECYAEYLTRMYGNYMQFPPPEKRVAHHYVKVVDLEKPYTFYV